MSVIAVARTLWCCAFLLSATVMPLPAMAQPEPLAGTGSPSLCIDEMETEPDYDDLQTIAVFVDGGCLISAEPISI